jgi:hypothetical protein
MHVVPSISLDGVAACRSTPTTNARHTKLRVTVDLPHLFTAATQQERNASRAGDDPVLATAGSRVSWLLLLICKVN